MPRRVERRSLTTGAATRGRRHTWRRRAPVERRRRRRRAGTDASPEIAAARRGAPSLKLIGRNAARAAERDADAAHAAPHAVEPQGSGARSSGISYKALLYKIKEHRLDDPTH